ncbi:MAG: hypothetical protein GY797_11560, partial [Deltaproteobacteria bacterium]|nr:hypothetical protein [Deltaproteobacteria bacterium]
RLKTDDLSTRLTKVFLNCMNQKRKQIILWNNLLYTNKPLGYIFILNDKLDNISDKLKTLNNIYLNNKRSLLRENTARLYALNPTEILKRGYSITRTIPEALLVKTSHSVSIGQNLEVMLAEGRLLVSVDQKK